MNYTRLYNWSPCTSFWSKQNYWCSI